MKNSRIIIIGAGPAGLGAAWRLNELGHDNFVVYDKNSYVGGLAASFTDEAGFTWDIGGHVLHSHYPYFDRMFEEVMEGQYLTHERESWVWIHDRFIPFPFQNNIHRLPAEARRECLDGLRKAGHGSVSPKTFSDWIRATYGDGIAKHFLFPYNRKVWAYPIGRMGFGWVADRVAPIDLSRIERNVKNNEDDVSWGPNAVFRYPEHGGTGDIWKRVSRRFAKHIRLGAEVTGIDEIKKRIVLSDGTTEPYDLLFTTLPLDRLWRMLKHENIAPGRGALVRTRVTVVGLGIQGAVPEHLRTKCWMYFPGRTIPFFRATVLSNYSPYNAPDGTWSLLLEISSSQYRKLPTGDIGSRVIDSVRKLPLVPRGSRIMQVWTMSTAYGYPVPTRSRDAYVDPAIARLGSLGIYSRGRFGIWKYEISNQDHTFMQGVEWAGSILEGTPEKTVPYARRSV